MSTLSADVLEHVVDVHCHPTDTPISQEDIQELPIKICAMATRLSDQELVANLARTNPRCVIPCFGFHPWFAHWISVDSEELSKEEHYRKLFAPQLSQAPDSGSEKSLLFDEMMTNFPEPIPLRDCLADIRKHFQEFPEAMLGEVGIDRSARIPIDSGAEERRLSPFILPFNHQLHILEAQIDLAVEMKRNISLHSVKAQDATLKLIEGMLKRHGDAWTQISIDFHSCGLSVETWKRIEKSHINAFLSLSSVINGRSPNHKKLIQAVSDTRILVESDIHEIGQVASRTTEMLRTVADIKGWKMEEQWDEDVEEDRWGAVRRLKYNFELFQKGDHQLSLEIK